MLCPVPWFALLGAMQERTTCMTLTIPLLQQTLQQAAMFKLTGEVKRHKPLSPRHSRKRRCKYANDDHCKVLLQCSHPFMQVT